MRTSPIRIAFVFATAAFLVALPACDDPQTTTRRAAVATTQPATEHLDSAMEFVENLERFREEEAQTKTAYHLNRWLENQKLSSSWKPDEMVNRLPRVVRDRGVADEFDRRLFSVEDVEAVQEAVWMRQLSNWVSRQPLPAFAAKWIESQESKLGAEDAEQLAIAFRLFDWTVRNIHLDELIADPNEATVAPTPGTSGEQAAVPAALRGIPGPGYQLEPWQVLLYGHGDAWQRMRIFTLLARQQGIDVVTLAFPGRTTPPRPRPWVSAVLLKDQLFLFDPKLGLPIPSSSPGSIATLAQVVDNPSLLESLSIDKYPYTVAKEDLAEVAALLDVTAPLLSRRLQLLESQLTGEHRTVLSVSLSKLAERLKGCRGLYDVYVWSVPFEADWFHAAYQAQLRQSQQALALHMQKLGMFANHSPLVRARYLYFRGQLEKDEDEPGAKEVLLNARINQGQLDDMVNNEEIQRSLGIERTGRETEAIWKAQLSGIRMMMIQTKQYASFWLGLFQLESGKYNSAIEWLKTRTLEPWPDGPFAPGARYNLARAHEAKGEFAKAQEVLLTEKHPLYEHGNYLRARLLQAGERGTLVP